MMITFTCGSIILMLETFTKKNFNNLPEKSKNGSDWIIKFKHDQSE
jgi:hypothetical protein